MKISVGSDERNPVTDAVVDEILRRGHQVALHGPLKDEVGHWPGVARVVAEEISKGQADEGLLFCWTGTGVSMAANKVPGVRAALCLDAETARAPVYGTMPICSVYRSVRLQKRSRKKSWKPGFQLATSQILKTILACESWPKSKSITSPKLDTEIRLVHVLEL